MNTERPIRVRYCQCSRAHVNRGAASAACVLHGNTAEAAAYRAGVADALSGAATEIPEARPVD